MVEMKNPIKEADAHPEIAVKSFRAPTEELTATMDMELKAGKPKFDVFSAGFPYIWTLQQKYKAFRTFSPNEGDHIIQGLRDPEQIQVPCGFGIYVIEYNTKLVSKEEAPQEEAPKAAPEKKEKKAKKAKAEGQEGAAKPKKEKKEPKESKEPKEPKEPKVPKEPKEPKEKKEA